MADVKEKVCLIVIDGWGISAETKGNAILNAKTPVMDRLTKTNGTEIEAHGQYVGLPEGLMGNSEVGHLNIGAGRVIIQDIDRINMTVTKGEFVNNKTFVDACNNAKSKSNGRLHLLGLVSDGGVHSHIEHMFGLAKAAKQLNVPKLFLQFFADGRDTSPTSGVGFIQQTLDFFKKENYGEIASIMGRYYAMDRDKRWERIQCAYEGLVGNRGDHVPKDQVVNYIKNERYNKQPKTESDEFLTPIILAEEGQIKDNDTLIFFDYRADRMREISETFGIQRHFQSTVAHPKDLYISTMTEYKKDFPFKVLFEPQSHKNVLAEWLASKNVSQFHCAETEKYAHVTFFFNGSREEAFPKEERFLIPSPKVPTYDTKPEMSVIEVAQKMAEVVKSKVHPFVMCNFAPPDMVGHTGQYDPTLIACETTDRAVGIVEEACKASDYVLLVTADHGNAEKMYDDKGGMHTAHTCNRVPFLSTGKRKFKAGSEIEGRKRALCDVAPTVLDLLGFDVPKEMPGKSLLEP